MVDINLIGEDQPREDGQENNEQAFRSSYEPESNEPTASSYMSGGTFDESDYARFASRGGSKKMVYILAAFSVILLAAVVWFMLQSSKGKKAGLQTPPVQQRTAEQVVPEQSSTPISSAPETSFPPSATISPALRDRIIKSHQGLATVSEIITAIPSNVNFTILSYSDGAFFVEYLATDDAAITAASNQLQQTIAPAEVKVLSKENRTIQNRSFRQALVNGNVNVRQSSADLATISAPSYVTGSELQRQFANIAQQTGLTIKQFEMGREKAEGEFSVLPIVFRAQGPKNGILAFLQQIKDANLNLSFAKISVIPGATLNNTNITLLLNIALYRVG